MAGFWMPARLRLPSIVGHLAAQMFCSSMPGVRHITIARVVMSKSKVLTRRSYCAASTRRSSRLHADQAEVLLVGGRDALAHADR